MIGTQQRHLGGIILYNQPEIILEQYDLEIKQMTKGRGAYICDTDCGRKLLVPFRGSKERAAFLREILIELDREGFLAEQICVTKDGEAVAEDEYGMRYWLKELVSGSECSAGSKNDMVNALMQLAELHKHLLSCRMEIPAFMKNERNEPGQLYRRHYRELVKVKNYVHSRKSRNDFEMSFQGQYPHYIQNAKDALGLLEEIETGEIQQIHLCHGDFNQHNALRTPEGIRIVNFENMNCNEPVVDLANFVRKMMEKNNWDTVLGMNLIEAYESRRKLSARERKFLYLSLLFPEKFWKLANHYSNSHKAWVSGRDIEKLNRMIEIEPKRTKFLENLFSFL